MVQEEEEEATITTTSLSAVPTTTPIPPPMATAISSHLSRMALNILLRILRPNTNSLALPATRITSSSSSSGPSMLSLSLANTQLRLPYLLRTTIPIMPSTYTSSKLPTARSSNLRTVFLHSSRPTASRTHPHNNQVVLRSNGALQHPRIPSRTNPISTNSNSAPEEVEEDIIARPRLSLWVLPSAWVLTMARLEIPTLQ